MTNPLNNPNPDSLAGRVAVVTGASGGIGRAIALEIACQGANVLIHGYRRKEAAEAAAAQGKFWEMHRLLFAKRKDLSQHFWRSDALSIGLDAAAFAGCLGGSAVTRVRADLAEGRRLGINSTPSFVIGVAQPDGSILITTKIRGAQAYQVFEKAIEQSL